MQNIKSFNPSWNEVLKRCPEVGLDDLISFSGDKQNCKPPWARLGYQGLSNNRVGLEDISVQFDQDGNQIFNRFNDLSHVLSGYISVKNSAVLSCLAGTKEISICPASSQSLNTGSLSSNPVDAGIENPIDTQEGAEVDQGFSKS